MHNNAKHVQLDTSLQGLEYLLAEDCGFDRSERDGMLKDYSHPVQIPVTTEEVANSVRRFITLGHLSVIVPGVVLFDPNPRISQYHQCIFSDESLGGFKMIGSSLKRLSRFEYMVAFDRLGPEEGKAVLTFAYSDCSDSDCYSGS